MSFIWQDVYIVYVVYALPFRLVICERQWKPIVSNNNTTEM